MNLRQQLISMEGWENEAYPDPLTKGEPYTIGVGHTGSEVHKGLRWTDDQIEDALSEDIAKAQAAVLDRWPWAQSLSEERFSVLVNMAFQMGAKGLSAFHHFLTAMEAGDWDEAVKQMKDSLWARQTPGRAARLAEQVKDSEWA